MKSGVVSIAHGWGALPGSNEDPAVTGSAVNALGGIDIQRSQIMAAARWTKPVK